MARTRADLQPLLDAHRLWNHLFAGGQQLVLVGDDLRRIDLSEVDLDGAILSEVLLDGANLAGADLSSTLCASSSFIAANLSGAAVVKADFAAVVAREADFSDSNLMRTGFWEADLRGTHLDRAALTKTSFARADLRDCSLRDARFDRTVFEDATFGNLDAAGASGTILAGLASLDTPDGPRRMAPNRCSSTLAPLERTSPSGNPAQQYEHPRRPHRYGRYGLTAAGHRREPRRWMVEVESACRHARFDCGI